MFFHGQSCSVYANRTNTTTFLCHGLWAVLYSRQHLRGVPGGPHTHLKHEARIGWNLGEVSSKSGAGSIVRAHLYQRPIRQWNNGWLWGPANIHGTLSQMTDSHTLAVALWRAVAVSLEMRCLLLLRQPCGEPGHKPVLSTAGPPACSLVHVASWVLVQFCCPPSPRTCCSFSHNHLQSGKGLGQRVQWKGAIPKGLIWIAREIGLGPVVFPHPYASGWLAPLLHAAHILNWSQSKQLASTTFFLNKSASHPAHLRVIENRHRAREIAIGLFELMVVLSPYKHFIINSLSG